MIGGREERRSYSICAPAGAPPRIGVREVPGGLFSPWLVREVSAGDVIDVSTPAGNFTPGPGVPGHHVLIAAGSGITPVLSIPVLSIAASVLDQPDTAATLLYGNRRTATIMFAEELSDLKDRYPSRLELIHVLSREERDAELLSGRLDGARLERLLRLLVDAAGVEHWWLCGPFAMVVEAREVLRRLGVPDDRVHRELFYVADVAPPPLRHDEPALRGPSSEVTVVLDGRATTLPIAATSSILEGAQRLRPDLPFACKGGVCGTCRARLVEGQVEMRRNFALEQDELDAGFVLTCQARPRSALVRVDYDS
jgi:ring-1,2-phenylacetyl-CoA epoxidase subunit PaaE